MFSHTGYDALYSYLGLSLQSKIMEVLLSQSFFQGAIFFIFGVVFFWTMIQFFSKYMPSALVKRRNVALSKFFTIILSLFFGLALLRVDSSVSITNFSGNSLHTNQYVKKNVNDVQQSYRVSFIFKLLTKTAEELNALASRVIDDLFTKTHSQLEAPNFFYKAIMYAGASTLNDQKLKEEMELYIENCLDKTLPLMKDDIVRSKLDGFFFRTHDIDSVLDSIVIELRNYGPVGYKWTCLDLKTDLRSDFLNYADSKAGIVKYIDQFVRGGLTSESWRNLHSSNILINYFLDKNESIIGIQKGSQLPNTTARVVQYLKKIFTFDNLISIFLGRETHGSVLAAERSQEFSELITRAPHIAGFIKLFLIVIFPFLVFPLVAGKWKWIVYWFTLYFSVLTWIPIWTFSYHLITNLALATGTMADLGNLYDGISLYSSKVVTSKIFYLYAVYSWIQIITGPVFTAFLAYKLTPLLGDTQTESAPDFIDDAKSAGSKTASVGAKAVGMMG